MSAQLSILEGLELHVGKLPGPKLIDDYYAGAPQLSSFYAGYPWSQAAFRKRADQVRKEFSPDRLAALRTSVQPTTPKAAEKLVRIAAGEGFVVTTGQQAGLFGGPLYTAYKILTAVRLAEVLETSLGVPVAPLFWIPADDADWDEVNHVYLIDAKNQLVRVELAGAAEPQVSMANRQIGPGIEDALAQVAQALPQNEFAADQLALLRRAYAPGRSIAEAYRDLIAETFASFDLLITSSSDPALKRFAAPIFQAELENASQHGQLLRGQTDRLIAAGYHEQVAIAPDAANVMYEDERGRERLVRDGNEWVLRRTKRRFAHDELMNILAREPERFSANVLLRPVVESYAFPTLAYVGGPAEVSYFGQTGCLFAAHGVTMPLVFPRASADVVEAKVRKVLDKFTLQPADLQRPFHELASQIAREELPAEVSALLHQVRETLTQGYGALVEATAQIDTTLRGPLEGARNASHKQVDDVERKILTHLKKQGEIGLEQLRKAAVNLYPDGERQERVIATLSFLGKYGPSFLTGVAALLDPEIGGREPEDWDGVRCA